MSSNSVEFIDFIVEERTLNQVGDAFQSDEEIVPINCEFTSLRLLRVNTGIINLEYLLRTPLGFTFEVAAQYSNDGKITLPHDFFVAFKSSAHLVATARYRVLDFSLLDNVLMAAFSLSSMLVILNGQDRKENVRGIILEYYLVEPGELNIYASERYGQISNQALATGHITVNNISINPRIPYTKDYHRLLELKLLSSSKVF